VNGLSPLEIAAHILVGRDEAAAARLESEAGTHGAVRALEAALAGRLQRVPCVVSFSGGRDSSALLALAVRVARREGLADPVPATVRVPSSPGSQEDEWQQLVVDHLGLAEWARLTVDDELDLVGPVAQSVMRAHGLPYPYNLHLQVPILEVARGGSLVTGLGGDEIFAPSARRRFAPRSVRRVAASRRPRLSFPWLRADADEELGRRWLDDELRLPLRWDRRAREWWSSRYLQQTIERIELLARDYDVSVVHPFAEAPFVAALAREIGPRGFESRELVLERLFGDVLPPQLPGRRTKATFNEVLWNRHTRALLEELDPDALARALDRLGVAGVVDAAALDRHWRGDAPLANSFLLLQGCCLVD
jgi:asparagine synthase (glutamine-hydrolysing)